MANYDDLHAGSDFPYTRAYAELMYSGDGADSWLLFEIGRARKENAPQDTVYCAINGEPYSIMDKRFDNVRNQLITIGEKNGWIPIINPVDECIGDPRTIEGWDDER